MCDLVAVFLSRGGAKSDEWHGASSIQSPGTYTYIGIGACGQNLGEGKLVPVDDGLGSEDGGGGRTQRDGGHQHSGQSSDDTAHDKAFVLL